VVLVPRIYGNTMKLSPSVIVIAIRIGATLMGILGALLAVAAAVPVVLRFAGQWQERKAEDKASPAPARP
jgi:predicted PurR-regulated permease PerM